MSNTFKTSLNVSRITGSQLNGPTLYLDRVNEPMISNGNERKVKDVTLFRLDLG